MRGLAQQAPLPPPTHADSSSIAEGRFRGDVRQRSCFRELWEETEGPKRASGLHAATVCVTSSEVTEVNTRDSPNKCNGARATGSRALQARCVQNTKAISVAERRLSPSL